MPVLLASTGFRTEDRLNLWSEAATWAPDPVPGAGDDVIIPSGYTVYMDVDTAALSSLTISGTLLNYGNTSVQMEAGYVMVESGGVFKVGTEGVPYTGTFGLTLSGTEASRATRYVADRTATSGTGNGRLTRLFSSTGSVAETITITWSSATAFSVSGSISGALGSGTVGVAFNNKVRFIAVAGTSAWVSGDTNTVTLVARGFTNSGVGRSLQVDPGGYLELIGNPPAVTRTRINADLAISDTSLTTADSVTWNSGDQIIVGPTDFISTASGISESFTLSSSAAATTTVALAAAATRYKWGVLQYPTDAGMSLTAGVLTNDSGSGSAEWDLIPKVLDERAMVMHMTRNIVIQGKNDTAWTSDRFGAHIMVMGLSSRCKINGVEFKRMGQAGAIGRYPIHFHMLSYNTPDGLTLPSDGTYLGDTTNANHYVKNSSVNVSSQRAMVIHGTAGVLLQNNNCYDITGHAIFLEDGSETNNTIDSNVVMQVTAPTSANKLLDHDVASFAGEAGSTGYWLSNPTNTVTDNWSVGAHVGFWNSFATSVCFGLSREIAINPKSSAVLEHSGNIGACNTFRGLMTEFPPTDNKGTVSAGFFSGILDSGNRFVFTGNIAYKNAKGAYLNRVNAPGLYTGWTVADNGQVDFSGQADHEVFLDSCLAVGVSLNNGNGAETYADDTRHSMFVSYDEGFIVRDLLAVNYPVRPPPTFNRGSFGGAMDNVQGGGLVRMGEYIYPIWTFSSYQYWKLVGSDPGFLCIPSHIDGGGATAANQRFTVGILKDTTGLFTGTVDRFVIHNDTFYTTDAVDLQPWSHVEAKHTSSQYSFINSWLASGIGETGVPHQPFYATRQDSGGSTVGVWEVPDSRSGGFGLSHFKHFAAMRDGIYTIGWNGELPSPSGGSTWVSFGIGMFLTSSDKFTLGVAWPNGVSIGTLYLRWRRDDSGSGSITQFEIDNTAGSPPKPLALKADNIGMTSRADVIAATSFKYWQDTINNIVWIKLIGGQIYDEMAVSSPSTVVNPSREFGLAIRSLTLPPLSKPHTGKAVANPTGLAARQSHQQRSKNTP